jgi:NMD protein affecting ribosome stability and mRNA decay
MSGHEKTHYNTKLGHFKTGSIIDAGTLHTHTPFGEGNTSAVVGAERKVGESVREGHRVAVYVCMSICEDCSAERSLQESTILETKRCK